MATPAIRCLLPALCIVIGCAKAPPDADDEFSDAAVFLLESFEGDDADVRDASLVLEEQIYLGMDVEADDANDRALTLERLTDDNVADIVHPEDRNPADALPVALGGVSTFEVEDHKIIQELTDQRPVEPYSPDKYDRTFFDGTEECWFDRQCTFLRTFNDLIKKNALMEVPYEFKKDFRWIDLAADPEDPRWAYVARSWTEESFDGTSGDSHILQSYTLELWIPRDGRGFVRGDGDVNTDDGEWTGDSEGSGTLHFLALWSETTFDGLAVSEDLVAATTRNGMEKNFDAAEEWLEENAP